VQRTVIQCRIRIGMRARTNTFETEDDDDAIDDEEKWVCFEKTFVQSQTKRLKRPLKVSQHLWFKKRKEDDDDEEKRDHRRESRER
jgi:hypothetical protein